MPDMHNWTKDEKDAVMNLLVSVAGYCPGKESLYEWLKKCELNSIIINNKAVFSQYAEVVKQQAGMDMNEKDIFDFLTEVKNSNINLNDLLATVNQLPQFYASWLMNRLLAEHPLGDKIWIWSKSVCVIDFRVQHNGESIRFAFDIPCEDLSNPGITFFARDDSTKIELFKETLDKQGYVFNSAWSRWCKHCCNTKYPDLTELEQILKEVKCCLEEMKKRKQELEK